MRKILVYSPYLRHHGIVGQKWGVRNGPPYPLGVSQKSAREKKQSTAKNTKRTSVIDAGKRFVSSKMASGIDGDMTALAVQATAYLATIGILYAAAKINTSRIRKKFNAELEDLFQNRSIKKLDDLPKLSDKNDASENVKMTNPGYPQYGRTENCTWCTTAMAMREKGFDVRAGETNHGWHTEDLFSKAWSATTQNMKQCKNSDQILQTLGQQGDGAYGNLSIYWRSGGGHSVFWKNENGRTNIYDGQQGKKLNLRIYEPMLNSPSSQFCRLDNCDPTDYVLALVEPNE